MSVNANLNQITFQSSLRSKPVRENFTDTENALNDLQSQINALATPPAGTEVTNARDNHAVLRDRLRSGFGLFDRYMVSGGLVSQDTGLNMKVTVALGEAVVAGVGCIWAAQTSGTITAPATNPRYDTVVVNSDNSISIVTGAESATPSYPSIASTQKALAQIYLTVGMTQIVDADISDYRDEPIYSNFMRGGRWASAGLVAADFSAGFGTVTEITIKMCRVGNSLRLIGSFKCGTVTAGVGTINLPTGFTHDMDANSGVGLTIFGEYKIIVDTGTHQLDNYGVAFYNGNSGSFDLGYGSDSGVIVNAGVASLTNGYSAPIIHLDLEIPVLGW